MAHKLTRAFLMLGVAGATLMASDTAFAQDGDIIVTARRVEERLQDVPISITAFTQDQITDRNIINAGDLATYTPSLNTNSRFGPENTTFAIRGFTQEGITSPSVAIYFADVVAPRGNGGTTAGNGAGPGSFFDLQNVQVLKGPQGTLFGRNTTGGAVLLVPQKPTGNLEGFVEGAIGNYDLRRFQAVINVPLADTFKVRLGIDRQKRDGYVNNLSGVGPDDFSDVDYLAARLSIVADLTPSLENYTIFTYSDSDTNGAYSKLYAPNFSARTSARARGFITAQLAGTPGFYDVLNSFPDPRQHIRQWGVINTTTWQASDHLTVKNIVSYTEFRQASSGNIFGDYAVVSNSPPTAWSIGVSLEPVPGGNNVEQSTFTEELQIQGHAFDDKLSYQIGGYLEIASPLGGFQSTLSSQNLDCSNVATFNCADEIGRQTAGTTPGSTREGQVGLITESRSKYWFRNRGLYAQATYNLTDSLSLTGGFRYTSDTTKGLGQALKANFFAPNVPTWGCAIPSPLTQGGTSAQVRSDPARCDFRAKASSSKPTWLIDVDFKPIDDVLLYAKYARGYRQGSVNVSSYGLEIWGPEKVDSYEVGAKTSFRGAIRGTFNVAAFYNKLSNQQLLVTGINCSAAELVTRPAQCPFIASAAAGIGNAGKSTIQGVEIDATLSPFDGLDLAFGYAYLDAKLDSADPIPAPPGFSTVLNRAVVGEQLPLVPKHKFSVSANYTLPLDESVGKVTLGATFTRQSKTFGSVSSPIGMQFLPSQDNLNLNLNWNGVAGSPFDLGLFATNVTKEKYFVSLIGASFGFDSAILNQPRMYGARLRYRFGN